MDLLTILEFVAEVGVTIVLLYLILSQAALYDKIEKLEKGDE